MRDEYRGKSVMRDDGDESAPPLRFRRVSPRLERCVADLPHRPTAGGVMVAILRHMVDNRVRSIAHSNSLHLLHAPSTCATLHFQHLYMYSGPSGPARVLVTYDFAILPGQPGSPRLKTPVPELSNMTVIYESKITTQFCE